MTGLPCREQIPGSIRPGRTAALVERDRRAYPAAVADIAHDRIGRDRIVEVDPENESNTQPVLLDEQLLTAMRSDVPLRAALAAFVAGRCTTDDPAADAAILAEVVSLVEAVDTSQRLGRAARPYVEAVMSLALLGQADAARARLEAMFAPGSPRSSADHLAAGHLAQLGSPMGYAVLLDDLHDRDSELDRQLAVGQLIAFLPYDGERVGDAVVDVRGELRLALRDKEADVGIDAIEAIIEADLDDAESLLEDATRRGHPKAVREAARAALEHRSSHG